MVIEELIALILEQRVFALLRAESADSAFRAAEAAIIGGIKIIEVALVTPGGLRVISDLRHSYGDRACIGAGSVMSYEHIDRAVKSGAQFIAMPHTNSLLIQACHRYRIPPLIGALTPTEVAAAWSSGASLINVFPASSLGGPNYIDSLTSRMAGIRLTASGGVGLENIADYFRAGAMAVGVGSELFTRGDLGNENYVAIAERARMMLRLAGVI